jgi:hypothetical protein
MPVARFSLATLGAIPSQQPQANISESAAIELIALVLEPIARDAACGDPPSHSPEASCPQAARFGTCAAREQHFIVVGPSSGSETRSAGVAVGVSGDFAATGSGCR